MEQKKGKEKRTITQIGRSKYLIKDNYQMWIARKSKDKDGEDLYIRLSGYYTTYKALLEGVARERILKVGGKDAQEALEDFAKAEREIKNLAKKLGEQL